MTNLQTDMSTDNKGHLELSTRKPTAGSAMPQSRRGNVYRGLQP